MLRLRIIEILEEQGHTKYWLFKRMDMLSYRNFKNIIDNETSSIRFEILDKLSRILDVLVGELFEQTDETTQAIYNHNILVWYGQFMTAGKSVLAWQDHLIFFWREKICSASHRIFMLVYYDSLKILPPVFLLISLP